MHKTLLMHCLDDWNQVLQLQFYRTVAGVASFVCY